MVLRRFRGALVPRAARAARQMQEAARLAQAPEPVSRAYAQASEEVLDEVCDVKCVGRVHGAQSALGVRGVPGRARLAVVRHRAR